MPADATTLFQWPYHTDEDFEKFVESLEMKYKLECLRAVRNSAARSADAPGDSRGESTEVGELASAYVHGLSWLRRTMRAGCDRATLEMRRTLASRRIDLDRLETDSWSVAAGEWSYLVDKGDALPRWLEHVAATLGGSSDAADAADAAADAAAEERGANHHLTLRVTRVKCKDETGSGLGEVGEDKISMGAVLIDTSGRSSIVREFKVGSFDDGDVKKLNRDLHTYKLDRDYKPAKAFTAIITLAEKDSGGFADFIQKLYSAVKKDLDKILMSIGMAAGAAIGASVGGTVGTLAGPLGVVLGAAAGAIVGAVVNWLLDVFNDDIFKPQSLLLALNSPQATFKGSLVSPEQLLRFKGHHGEYAVYCVWRLDRA